MIQRYISFERIIDFNMTILPIGVVDLLAQQLNSFLVSKYLSRVFIFSISSKLFVNQSPRILNFGGFHVIFRWGSHLASEFFKLPSHTLFVFSALSLSPEISPNLFKK